MNWRRNFTCMGLLTVGLTSSPVLAEDSPKTDPRIIRDLSTKEVVTVIVEMGSGQRGRLVTETPPLDIPINRYAVRKEALLNRVRAVGDLTVLKAYDALPMLAVEANAAMVQALARDEDVARLHYDGLMYPTLESTLPAISAETFHQSRSRGAGTAVAVLDSPVRFDNGSFGTCPTPGAPSCQVKEWQSFAPQTPTYVMQKEDEWGIGSHGSNVAGIVLGVAPETDLIGVNVFFADEASNTVLARDSDIIDGLNWVAANAARLGIVAVNMSLGTSSDSPATCNVHPYTVPMLVLYRDHGILSVIASGNDGETNIVSAPGCISFAVTVGAQHDGNPSTYNGGCLQEDPFPYEVACFTNRNGIVDLMAPGVSVDAGGFEGYSGTSMAAPHVAGAIAAMQASVIDTRGAPQSPYWAQKTLLADATLPLVTTDGRRYHRLELTSGFSWNRGWSFGGWFGENDNGRILGQTGRTMTLDVTDQGWNVKSVYLYLEISHPNPAAVVAELTAPDGTSVPVRLPTGQSHFTGFIGRMIEPGAFAALEGAAVDGQWTLTLRDTTGSSDGYYLDGVLLAVQESCVPDCSTGCGDDGCGGSCGSVCLIEGQCQEDGQTQPNNECFACRADLDPNDWRRSDAACLIGGQCIPADERQADNACFQCVPTMNADGWSRSADTCLIEGQCYAAGEQDPNNPCFVCDPTANPDGWSRTPDTCLIDGQCYVDGQTQTDNACFSCQPSQSDTAWARTDGTCLIDSQCYQAGDARPDTPCQTCQPATDVAAWTLADGNCLIDGQCYADQAPQTAGACALCDTETSVDEFTAATDTECVVEGECAGPGVCQDGTCIPNACPEEEKEGCRCVTPPSQGPRGAWALGLVVLALIRGRRRRFNRR